MGAGPDRELRLATHLPRLADHILHHRKRRGLRAEPGQKRVDGAVRALDLGDDPVGVIEDKAAELQLAGQPVHVGAKAHALDGAVHAHPGPAAPAYGRTHGHRASSRSAW